MRFILYISLFCVLSSCWPASVSFVDKGGMPEEWKIFSVKTLENNAPNAPLSYAALLSEDVKDGVQNNTKLKLNSSPNTGEVQIEGAVMNYFVSPIAIQAGDVAAKNRLTITVNFKIYIKAPKEDEMNLTATRFFDFETKVDFATVEKELVTEINKQIVQDVINKLLSNW